MNIFICLGKSGAMCNRQCSKFQAGRCGTIGLISTVSQLVEPSRHENIPKLEPTVTLRRKHVSIATVSYFPRQGDRACILKLPLDLALSL